MLNLSNRKSKMLRRLKRHDIIVLGYTKDYENLCSVAVLHFVSPV